MYNNENELFFYNMRHFWEA